MDKWDDNAQGHFLSCTSIMVNICYIVSLYKLQQAKLVIYYIFLRSINTCTPF